MWGITFIIDRDALEVYLGVGKVSGYVEIRGFQRIVY